MPELELTPEHAIDSKHISGFNDAMHMPIASQTIANKRSWLKQTLTASSLVFSGFIGGIIFGFDFTNSLIFFR